MNRHDENNALNFVLCWHMHQPWYQQGVEGAYRLPWVYLHALKDYEDMIMHLEAHPDMHVVVNFAPVLLEQIDDYVHQIDAWLTNGEVMKDPMLNLLSGADAIPGDIASRQRIYEDCQRANAEKMIDPYPAFRHLLDFGKPLADDSAEHRVGEAGDRIAYLNAQYFIDLLVWYHLAWLGHALKQTATSKRLIKKAGHYTPDDRRELMELIFTCMKNLIPRYRRCAQSGQIELSMTPYSHPIVPLLNDFGNMQCAQPEAPAPQCENYPDGVNRSRWHIRKGLEVFERFFGMRPQGIWLSEGAVSEDAVALIESFDFKWTASGEGVWRNSMRLSGQGGERMHGKRSLFHPYVLPGHQPRLFFRDDGLSDLIGFEYSKRNSDEAASELVGHLENISDFLGEDAAHHVVSIILDGENAWEYYPHNGYYFLDRLYQALSSHSLVRATTFSRVIETVKTRELQTLCAGSWVYGSFSTWIGEADKNRAWELLVEAKRHYDQVARSNTLSEEEMHMATRQLAICEGSDWFWWFGEVNASQSVSSFDILFREQLKNLYRLLKLDPPAQLQQPVSLGGGNQAENAGTMVRNVG